MNLITRIHIIYADRKERKKLYKLYSKMNHVGKNVHICKNYKITSLNNMSLGSHIWIGENFYARAEGSININDGCILSRNVEIWTSNHNYDSDDLTMIPYDRRMVLKPVTIKENVWIGTNVIILPGVTIEEGAVIGAGAVVSKDVPAFAVVGGNPAKVLKFRNVDRYKLLKSQNKVYLDQEYDYDKSSLRKSEW